MTEQTALEGLEPPTPAAPVSLEPVELEIVRQCHFKAKGEGKRGCGRCGAPKWDVTHIGAPPSINLLGSGNPQAYQGMKARWQALLSDHLRASGLPTGLERVLVEGQITFPDRGRRDQGNYRVLLEKALGDALKVGGWLDDDDWSRYEFGGLAYAYERGVSRTRLIIFPSVASSG
jgi:hypothetical protein